MTFISFGYLFLLLPITVLLYVGFRRNTLLANIVLLSASYVFYGISAAWYLIPLLISSLLDFTIGIALSSTKDPRRRKIFLIFSLCANLGLLFFFKYTPWLIETANSGLLAIGADWRLPTLSVPLPPGISFYTFQTMSYTIDIYRQEMQPSRNLINYLSFVTLWPQLVAGPIERATDLIKQLEKVRPAISTEDFRYALMLIIWGLFKKIVLADNFGQITDSIHNLFAAQGTFAGGGLLFAYAFAGQIYCDFSAYTDIARGSAKLVGIDLMRNFHTPYFSASPTEFWRRWHISLSTWLRDYLYIPLGGNRHGRWQEYRNLMITMVLGGFWHGAGILFILWGLWHGLVLILYRIMPIHRILGKYLGSVGKWLSILVTFHIICFGWILFRAQITTVMPIMRSIVDLFQANDLSLFRIYGRGLIVLGSMLLATDLIGYFRNEEFPDTFKRFNPYFASFVTVVFYLGIVLLGKRESALFIYFQF